MQSKPGTIVVGVDGSEGSNRALEWGAHQAAVENRTLTLVHVIHLVSPAFIEGTAFDDGQTRVAFTNEGHRILDAARGQVESMGHDVEVREIVEVADPRAALLQLSENATMLVVGSRGRGKIGSLLLGSVSVAVARHAHCPVVIIRSGGTDTVRDGVLVGVDATELSHPVLEFAYRHASVHGLALSVVHYLADPFAGTASASFIYADASDIEEEKMMLAEAMAGMAEKYPDVQVRTQLAKGLPGEGLVRLGEGMQLIVVGSHQDNLVRRAFQGSVSIDVVEQATSPVAVVPLVQSASNAG